MSSRSSSTLSIFSPKLKLVTKMFGLSARNENTSEPQQQGNAMPSSQQHNYVVSSEGIEVQQPQVADDTDLKGGSPSSMTSSKTEGSEIEVSADHSTPRITVVEKTDDEKVVPALLQRRGRHVAGLELAKDGACDMRNTTAAIPVVTGNIPRPATDAEYTYVKHLGAGGEGDCSLVERGSDKKLFAVKTVREPHLVLRKPIEAMVDILTVHKHKNIIRLHHWTSVSGNYLVNYYFEYCEGGDLFDLVRQYDIHNKAIPELFIWHTFLGVGAALDFLHRGFDPKVNDRVGIVHRDIKPENIFLRLPTNTGDYPDVVLADFGMASFEFATYASAGTFVWQPPELPRKAPKGDVWSLGAVIHYMIHQKLVIADLPQGVENTIETEDFWSTRPEARQPLTEVPEPYSTALVEMMLMACEIDHNKRINSSRLLKLLTDFRNKYLQPEQGTTWGQLWPLEKWALGSALEQEDTVVGSDLGGQNIQSADYGDGNDQYFEAMREWCLERFYKEACPGSPLRSVSITLSPSTVFASF